MTTPKEDASQRPAQRSVEAARVEQAQLRAQGLRKGSGDTAPRLQLAEKIQPEDNIQYERRLINHKLITPKHED